MARLTSVNLSGVGIANPILINVNINPVNISLAVELSNGAVLTYSVEHTYGPTSTLADIQNAVWFPFFEDQTATSDGYYAFPVTAVRLKITAYTSGTATLRLLQTGS
jgi:hypothetical protein